ncbi:phosphoribosylpyrophosphate synthetase [Aquimarina sp. W85]|uniref:phosphoribosylpyrophosphate synthetase n=1 Tax=Aquimarina rhodophyticola TaxID=3342246 RepID=UPI0036722880
MHHLDTLSQQMNSLKEEGYTTEFELNNNKIIDHKSSNSYTIDEFEVVQTFRFEGASNPADSSILYAIKTSQGDKGILLGAYGVDGEEVSKEMIDKLRAVNS